MSTSCAALLHDFGDTICTLSLAELGAAILKPFVSPENPWMVANHDIKVGPEVGPKNARIGNILDNSRVYGGVGSQRSTSLRGRPTRMSGRHESRNLHHGHRGRDAEL